MVIYDGQKQGAVGGSAAHKVVSAAELARADIVLTTYDVLRRDLNLEPQAAATRSLRGVKKYEVGLPRLGHAPGLHPDRLQGGQLLCAGQGSLGDLRAMAVPSPLTWPQLRRSAGR